MLTSTQAKVRKFPCLQCGADVRWDPGATSLKCDYCGALRDVAPSGPAVVEKSVDAALRQPRDLGWGAERKVIACQRCGAHTALDPQVAAAECAFCGTAAVVEAPPDAKMVRPEGLLPFRVTRETAVERFRQWISGLWFRPGDLETRARLANIHGAYIPFWTFDAVTDSWWTAEAGYYYYVDVQVRQNGRLVTRRERRVRWEPASGTLQKFFDDVPVPASRGIEADLCREIEPFPTGELAPYDPSYLAGFLAEENAVDLPEALEQARQRMHVAIRAACAAEVPGDTQRNLEVTTRFSALAYKNCLLPIWIAAYEYHGRPYRFLVNGVTGKVSGRAPWSWVKIGLAVLAAAALAIALLALFGQS
ncbi:MAG TPA: zinc ribbon domain-containing protein [Thermoanaerobaculia bacterium]|nr:zinc ribbon domain-containing protein [Thermoanaerobaculia bacterium]